MNHLETDYNNLFEIERNLGSIVRRIFDEDTVSTYHLLEMPKNPTNSGLMPRKA